MFHIFVREPLTPRTLRQPHIPSAARLYWRRRRSVLPANRSRIFDRSGRCDRDGRVSCREACGTGRILWVTGADVGGLAAREDVVELGDGVAAFDADGHGMCLHLSGKHSEFGKDTLGYAVELVSGISST